MINATPQRIQRKRTKGWRMPKGAVYVGRPGKWGNPTRPNHPTYGSHMLAVAVYADALADGELPVSEGDARRELKGKPLVCW